MSEGALNLSALEPLFAPHEEPNLHRVRAKDGQPAEAKRGRRPSPIVIAQNLRRFVKEWRETDYPGASDTTRELLHHWFQRDHLIALADGTSVPFRYYFCQREAIETLIYLYEVRGVRSLYGLTGEFAGPDAETAALGVNPDDDRWAKLCLQARDGRGQDESDEPGDCVELLPRAARKRFADGAAFRGHRAEPHGVRAAENGFQTGGRRQGYFRQRPADSRGVARRLEFVRRVAGRSERRGDGRDALPDEHSPALRHERARERRKRKLTAGWGRRCRGRRRWTRARRCASASRATSA